MLARVFQALSASSAYRSLRCGLGIVDTLDNSRTEGDLHSLDESFPTRKTDMV
jgi:hypothetical protein